MGVQPTDLTLHAPPVVDSDGVGEADVATAIVDSGDGGVVVTAGVSAEPEPDVTETVVAGEDAVPFYRRRPVIVGSVAALIVAVVAGVILTSGNETQPEAAPTSVTQTPEATTLPVGVVPAVDASIDTDQVLGRLLDEAQSVAAARALLCPNGLAKDFRGQEFTGQILENMDLDVDFRCADLSGADFSSIEFRRRVSFAGADLSEANLENTRYVDGFDFHGVIAIDTNFSDAVFGGGGFQNADLTGSDFSSALFIESTFKGAVVDQATFRGAFILGANLDFGSLLGTDMTDSKLYYSFAGGPLEVDTADWTGATCSDGSAAELHEPGCLAVDSVVGTSIPRSGWCPEDVQRLAAPPRVGARLENMIFHCVDLSGLDLRGTDWSNSLLIGVDFTDANLTAARMSGATLIGVTFSNTVMLEMDATSSSWWDVDADDVDFKDLSVQGSEDQDPFQLRWMNLDGRDLSSLRGFVLIYGTSVRGANLTGLVLETCGLVDLEGADLTGATLRGGWDMTPFVGATMRDVQMSDSNMLEVDLSGADLTGAVATNVAFNGANLSGAIVNGADFTDAIWGDTTCPDGSFSNTNNFGRCDV